MKLQSQHQILPLRINSIDTLRGLAAQSVVLSHFYLAFELPESFLRKYAHTPLHIIWDGSAAVSLFFVISGFVLSLKYVKSDAAPGKLCLRDFYFGRICRILFPFWVILLISYICCHYWWYQHDTLRNTFPYPSSWLYSNWSSLDGAIDTSFMKQALLLFPGASHFYVPQAWTLSLEMQMSLIMPLLIVWARKYCLTLGLFTVILCAAELYYQPVIAYGQYVMVFFHFVLGVCTARYLSDIKRILCNRSVLLRGVLWISAFSLYGVRYSFYLWFSEPFREASIWYLNATGSFLIILLLLTSDKLQSIFNILWLRFLGKISYRIYLCHFLLLIAWIPLLGLQMNNSLDINDKMAYYLTMFAVILLNLIVGTFFYFLIEKQCLILRHSLRKG